LLKNYEAKMGTCEIGSARALISITRDRFIRRGEEHKMDRALPFFVLSIVVLFVPAIAGPEYKPTAGVAAIWGGIVMGAWLAGCVALLFKCP
jgi:hypothetical protein